MAIRSPDDGEDIAEPFMNKPSRKLYPDYYKIIAHPISLNDMRVRQRQPRRLDSDAGLQHSTQRIRLPLQKKIEREAYSSMDDFAADMELMVQNARTYNEEESDIVRWVMLLLVCTHAHRVLQRGAWGLTAAGRICTAGRVQRGARQDEARRSDPSRSGEEPPPRHTHQERHAQY
jgi:hypothetical protein